MWRELESDYVALSNEENVLSKELILNLIKLWSFMRSEKIAADNLSPLVISSMQSSLSWWINPDQTQEGGVMQSFVLVKHTALIVESFFIGLISFDLSVYECELW